MQLKQTIAVLVNPLGNKKRTGQIVAGIVQGLSQREIPFVIFDVTWPAAIEQYQEVWIVGGDGTLNYFLNFYKNPIVPIVIFKGGTGNDFSTKLYGKSTVQQQVESVLAAGIRRVDAAECNGQKFINGVGIGFDGEVLRSIRSIRSLGGHLGYLSIVLRKIFSFKEFRFRIQYGDDTLDDKFLLVMVTNSTTTGGGFMVSPEAKIDDGKLNMVLCKPLPVLKRLLNLPKIEKGKHLSKVFIVHQEISSIRIACEKETPAQIDGELIHEKIFEIKILPGYCQFKY